MEYARSSLVGFFQDLVNLFGKTGAEALVCFFLVAIVLILAFAVFFGYLVLHFGETTFNSALKFALEAFRVFKYQPKQKTHQSIRIELYFDSILALVAILSLIGLLGHSLIPWVKEQSENYLFEIFISSFIVLVLLIPVSIKIASRFPHQD